MGGLIAQRVANVEPQISGVIFSASSSGCVNRTPENQKKFLEERLAPIEAGISIQDSAEPLLRQVMADGAKGPLVDQVFEVV